MVYLDHIIISYLSMFILLNSIIQIILSFISYLSIYFSYVYFLNCLLTFLICNCSNFTLLLNFTIFYRTGTCPDPNPQSVNLKNIFRYTSQKTRTQNFQYLNLNLNLNQNIAPYFSNQFSYLLSSARRFGPSNTLVRGRPIKGVYVNLFGSFGVSTPSCSDPLHSMQKGFMVHRSCINPYGRIAKATLQ